MQKKGVSALQRNKQHLQIVILCKKLPNNVKWTGNSIGFKKELKDLLSKGHYWTDYLTKEFFNISYWLEDSITRLHF
jgi:hypothetical protein